MTGKLLRFPQDMLRAVWARTGVKAAKRMTGVGETYSLKLEKTDSRRRTNRD